MELPFWLRLRGSRFFKSQTSEILAAEKTTSSRVSADFTLICDRQHDITESRTRDLTTPEQRSNRLRHVLPHANMFATQRNLQLKI